MAAASGRVATPISSGTSESSGFLYVEIAAHIGGEYLATSRNIKRRRRQTLSYFSTDL